MNSPARLFRRSAGSVITFVGQQPHQVHLLAGAERFPGRRLQEQLLQRLDLLALLVDVRFELVVLVFEFVDARFRFNGLLLGLDSAPFHRLWQHTKQLNTQLSRLIRSLFVIGLRSQIIGRIDNATVKRATRADDCIRRWPNILTKNRIPEQTSLLRRRFFI